jgi:predicted nucleotidyltransferase
MDNLLKLIYVLGKHLGDMLTVRQLSKEAGIPYTTTRREIEKAKSIFVLKKKGNLKLISLNLEDNITKIYLILAERKKADSFIRKNPIFKLIRKEIPKGRYTLVLFGSRAEGKERDKSDVDLCIVNKKGENNISFSRFELLFELEFNPIYLRDIEFKQMLKQKNHNLSDEILKKHIILYGEEYFWNLIWTNGIRPRFLQKGI